MPYEEKLVLALGHPIRENHIMAIQLLGELRSQQALGHFEKILSGESDLFVIREVLRALAKLDCPRSRAILSSATRHPSKLVRKLAHALLRSVPEQGLPQL
jgi:HEAT repeat protein